MKILMVTNTYLPHVGGVARSVEVFTQSFRQRGNRVMIVCPSFSGVESTPDVLRVPALEHFRGGDFSFPLPIPVGVHRTVDQFGPDIVHSHHPFLLGDTALRIGAERGLPVVFTHHTQYDKYAHHLGVANSKLVARFINDLDVGYCELAGAVVAPSRTVKDDLLARGVTTPISVVPTGVDLQWWSGGSRRKARAEIGIPRDAWVVGHVGRLAEEKNIPFLAEAVATFLSQRPDAWFIVGGTGPCEQEVLIACEKHAVMDRLLTFGQLDPARLRNLYYAMDVFAFASFSETQGIVLAEAMASGVPVVAIDAPGVREIVTDRQNGRLLPTQNLDGFVDALTWIAELDQDSRAAMAAELEKTVAEYSTDSSADKMLGLYERAIQAHQAGDPERLREWRLQVRRIEQELKIWGNIAHAIGDSIARTALGDQVT